MTHTQTQKTKTPKKVRRQEETPGKPKHSQLGKAIIEGLQDIKDGNIVVIEKDNFEKDVHKLLE